MLVEFNRLRDMNREELMRVYWESNEKHGMAQYPREDANVRRIYAEQDFWQYLNDCFFSGKGARYAVWEESGIYRSALRLEPYQDGLLLEGLETAPDMRRRGYGKALLQSVLSRLSAEGAMPVYSHVRRRNIASWKVHTACGFQKLLDYSVWIDGSVSTDACTLIYRESHE